MSNKRFTKKVVTDFLSHVEGEEINISYELLSLIWESNTDGKKAIQTIFELNEITKSDKSQPVATYVTKEEYDELFQKYTSYVLSFLELLIESCPSTESFYTQLWEFINNDELIKPMEAKAFVFSLLLNDVRLPYHEFNIVSKMDREEFFNIRRKIGMTISKARFAIYLQNVHPTQVAAYLLETMNELNDEKEKQVLLTSILAYNAKRAGKNRDD